MQEFRLWIRDVGFPAAIAFFVLLRVDVTINRIGEKFSDSMAMVAEAIYTVTANQQKIMDAQKAIADTLVKCCGGPPMPWPEAEQPQRHRQQP